MLYCVLWCCLPLCIPLPGQLSSLQTAKGGVYSEIWDGMTSHSGSIVDGSEAGFRKTKTENYAFIGDKTYLGSYAAGDSDLILLPEEFYKVGFGFALPKDWPYTEYINDVLVFIWVRFKFIVQCSIVLTVFISLLSLLYFTQGGRPGRG